MVKENPEIDAATFMPDRRYSHIVQVQERLNFLRFLLKVYRRLDTHYIPFSHLLNSIYIAGWAAVVVRRTGQTDMAVFG